MWLRAAHVRMVLVVGLAVAGLWLAARTPLAQPSLLRGIQPRPDPSGAPVIVVETSAGAFAFEMYTDEAPMSVNHIVDLVKRGFYDGQRVHRAVPGFVVQWGDPQSRDLAKDAVWGKGPAAGSGTPIGVTEFSKKRLHAKGVVALAHPGVPAQADSQLYVTLAPRTDLDGKYVVIGHLVAGLDVPERLQRGDLVRRVYVKD